MSISLMEHIELFWTYLPCIKLFLLTNTLFLLIVLLQGEVANRRSRILYRSIKRKSSQWNGNAAPKVFSSDDICPICLESARLVVVTSCGHLFCGRCVVILFQRHGVQCPCCRDRVKRLFTCCSPGDKADADELDALQVQIECINERLFCQRRPTISRLQLSDEYPEVSCFFWFLLWTLLSVVCVLFI